VSYIVYIILKSLCRNYVTPTCETQEDNSIDARNPNHSCLLEIIMYFLHDKCRLNRKSLLSILELNPLVLVLALEHRFLDNIRDVNIHCDGLLRLTMMVMMNSTLGV